jgi:crotonobetainyl-CoA:carnitine CoA-transferase CaiB-like acyl-CoA transferase
VLAALFHRQRTGRGQRIEGSLLGGQIWAQASEYTHHLMTGELPGRGHYSHPLLRGVYGIFETSDGWIGIVGVPPDSRDAFFIAMNQPELALDERYLGLLTSRDDLTELFERLNPVFKTKTTDEWCMALREMGVRYAPVRNYADAAVDPGAWENGYFQEATDESGETHKIVGTPIRMSLTPLEPSAEVPTLGQHTEEILNQHGLSDDDIAELRTRNII